MGTKEIQLDACFLDGENKIKQSELFLNNKPVIN